MADLEVKGFDSPDEVRPFEGKGQVELVNVAGRMVGPGHVRARLEVVRKRQADRRHRLVPDQPPRLRALRAACTSAWTTAPKARRGPATSS